MNRKLYRIMFTVLTVMLVLTVSVFADEYYGAVQSNDSAAIYAVIILVVPALIAFVMMSAKMKQMKTATRQHYANDYMKQGSFKVDVSTDIYLYSNVVKTRRPKPQNRN